MQETNHTKPVSTPEEGPGAPPRPRNPAKPGNRIAGKSSERISELDHEICRGTEEGLLRTGVAVLDCLAGRSPHVAGLVWLSRDPPCHGLERDRTPIRTCGTWTWIVELVSLCVRATCLQRRCLKRADIAEVRAHFSCTATSMEPASDRIEELPENVGHHQAHLHRARGQPQMRHSCFEMAISASTI